MGAAVLTRSDQACEGEPLLALSLLLQHQKGIRLLDYKSRWLERRLLTRVRATRCADVASYVEYVRQNPEEADRLLETLSINVSSFFRNPEVYRAIADTVFPAWKSEVAEGHRRLFRSWSCACAQGEEPYSLSVLWEHWMAQSFSGQERTVDLKITASDVDADALSRARAAQYNVSVLKEMPSYGQDYFEKIGGHVTVLARVRRRVQFVCENVLVPARRPRVDLILCRNFLIFLDRPGRDGMLRICEQSLVPGGFLVLGRAETAAGSGCASLVPVDSVHRIYRKIEDGVRLK